MARVVQRKSTPNIMYLLIVFVFLFLAAVGAAAMLYTGQEDKNLTIENDQKDIRALRSELAQAKQVQADSLSKSTDLTEVTYDDFKERTAKYSKGLLQEISDRDIKIQKLEKDLEAQKDLVAAAEKRVDAADKTHADAFAKLQEDYSALQTQYAALADGFKEASGNFTDALNAANDTFDKTLKKLEESITSTDKDNLALKETVANLRAESRRMLRDFIHEKNDLMADFFEVDERGANGTVKDVMSDQQIVYIDLGSNDGVKAGMTFGVWSADGVTNDPPKGRIEVFRASPNISECHVTLQDTVNPIASGDVVKNMVLSGRPRDFMVMGQFDLTGSGKPTDEGARQVREMITRAGGNVAADLTYKTDVLVLGEEPLKPLKPTDDDSREAQDEYDRQLKAYDQFIKVRDQATASRILILDGNRFLDLMGYAKKK